MKMEGQMANKMLDLNPKLKNFAHAISVTGTFMMLFGFIYILQVILFGFIPQIRSLAISGIKVSPFIFTITTILLIKSFFTIKSPYE